MPRAMVALGYSKTFTYLMGAGIGWSLWSLTQTAPPLLETAFLVVFSFVMTDMISGLLHVILDNPRSLEVGAIRGLAEGFQRHHEDPDKIYRMPLYEHLYVMHLPLTLLFVVCLPFHSPHMYVVFLSMVFALHLMQMAHLWAHLPPARVPSMVRRLQGARVLLSKPRHDLHHQPPYAKDFCIMTGMCNPALNAAVRVIGGRTHWWNAVFLVVALSPMSVALLLAAL